MLFLDILTFFVSISTLKLASIEWIDYNNSLDCSPACKLVCPNGFVKDEDGFNTCECKEKGKYI